MIDGIKLELTEDEQAIFDYLSNISSNYFDDIVLICNPVLNKISSFIESLFIPGLSKKRLKIGYAQLALKLISFFLKNSAYLALHFIVKQIYFTAGNKKTRSIEGDLTFLDTYFQIEKILYEKKISDNYFCSLSTWLEENGKVFYYTPRFYANYLKLSFLQWFRFFRLLRLKQVPVITEFQTLTCKDYFASIAFIFNYPIKLIKLIRALSSNKEKDLHLRYILLNNLDKLVMPAYLRYRYGCALGKIAEGSIQCISWYENTSLEKCFYRGLRKEQKKTLIYGVQAFIWPAAMLHINVDPKEIKHQVVPDTVLVNGEYYLRTDHFFGYRIGPAFRYHYLFEPFSMQQDKNCILVLLPYYPEKIVSILQVLKGIKISKPLLIKFHPAVRSSEYRDRLPFGAKVSNEELPTLFQKSCAVIGVATGAMIEAIVLGIPVITVADNKVPKYDYLPSYGKGLVWESISNSKEIESRLIQLNKYRETQGAKIEKIRSDYKRLFFNRVDDELLTELFK